MTMKASSATNAVRDAGNIPAILGTFVATSVPVKTKPIKGRF